MSFWNRLSICVLLPSLVYDLFRLYDAIDQYKSLHKPIAGLLATLVLLGFVWWNHNASKNKNDDDDDDEGIYVHY